MGREGTIHIRNPYDGSPQTAEELAWATNEDLRASEAEVVASMPPVKRFFVRIMDRVLGDPNEPMEFIDLY